MTTIKRQQITAKINQARGRVDALAEAANLAREFGAPAFKGTPAHGLYSSIVALFEQAERDLESAQDEIATEMSDAT